MFFFANLRRGTTSGVIFGSASSWSVVKSGVPQGSVLGPLLFNLFINDISDNVNSTCVQFADDILMYRPIDCNSDIIHLQDDLQHLSTWSISNGMSFNTSKSKIMHISRKRNLALPTYFLAGDQLSAVNSVKYLGVTLSAQLTWNDHIDSVTSSANRILGLIRSIAFNASMPAKLCLYKSLVLPVLEYGLPAWLPHTRRQEDALERVQKRATQFILGQRIGEMPYHDRLVSLNWSALSNRRNYAVLSFITKCLYNLVHCDISDIVVNTRRSDVLTFNHLLARTQALHLSATHQFPRLWSDLNSNVRNSLILQPLSSFLNTLKHTVLFPDPVE